jgi:hypothetical protein
MMPKTTVKIPPVQVRKKETAFLPRSPSESPLASVDVGNRVFFAKKSRTEDGRQGRKKANLVAKTSGQSR